MVVEHQRSTSFWHRSVRRVIDVLDRKIVSHLIPPLAANAPPSTFFDRVKIIVDTTFVPLPKSPFLPKDYHKKSPMKAAWKYEIACDFSHRIVSVSDDYHGGAHDMRIIRESGLLDQASDDAQIMGDRGYKGKLGIVVPASKKAKVSKEVQQLENLRDSEGMSCKLSERPSKTSMSV